jgi:hypothetical protein
LNPGLQRQTPTRVSPGFRAAKAARFSSRGESQPALDSDPNDVTAQSIAKPIANFFVLLVFIFAYSFYFKLTKSRFVC